MNSSSLNTRSFRRPTSPSLDTEKLKMVFRGFRETCLRIAQDNLHAQAQNPAIFPQLVGEKTVHGKLVHGTEGTPKQPREKKNRQKL